MVLTIVFISYIILIYTFKFDTAKGFHTNAWTIILFVNYRPYHIFLNS